MRSSGGQKKKNKKNRHALYSPIPLVLEQHLVLEEESAIEAAHIAVRDAVGVDDALFRHLLAPLRRLGLVYPIWL
jgi:hypothetical protein